MPFEGRTFAILKNGRRRRRIFELVFHEGALVKGKRALPRNWTERESIESSFRYERFKRFRKRYRSPPETQRSKVTPRCCRLPNRVAACSCSVVIFRLVAYSDQQHCNTIHRCLFLMCSLFYERSRCVGQHEEYRAIPTDVYYSNIYSVCVCMLFRNNFCSSKCKFFHGLIVAWERVTHSTLPRYRAFVLQHGVAKTSRSRVESFAWNKFDENSFDERTIFNSFFPDN